METVTCITGLRRAAARRELLATTMLASLGLGPAPLAMAQNAPATTAAGSVTLPTINVEGYETGTGYSAPPVLQSTTKLDMPTFDLPVSVQTVPY
jgi:hypothetical protein